MLDSSKLEVVRFFSLNMADDYEYDREAVVTSAPVRRLQQKTQVYPLDIHASSRSRLTHSLEVQSRCRSIVTRLADRLDFYQDNLMVIMSICETSALVHDVGNPPFGHFGEQVLSNFLQSNLEKIYQSAIGATPSAQWQDILAPDLITFDGNSQNLRILHSIQKLNLSAQVLGTCIKIPYLIGESTDDEIGCFYSESYLMQFIRDALELGVGCRFDLVNILEYADNICYAMADIEDSLDRGLITLDDLRKDLVTFCNEDAGQLLTEMLDHCVESGCNFIEYFRLNCLPKAIDHFADFYASAVQFTPEDLVFDYNDPPNIIIEAMMVYARKKIFKKPGIESLEIKGHHALLVLLKVYSRILSLPKKDFQRLLSGGELKDPMLSRITHRISRRVMECYVESLADKNLSFSDENEKELYFRIRLIIDYISGMTDTYVQAEAGLLSGL